MVVFCVESIENMESQIFWSPSLSEAADVVILDNIGEWYIVGECKAATERVTKKDVKQGESYARTMRAQWLIMTNGRDVFDCYNDEPRTGCVQVPLEKLPRF